MDNNNPLHKFMGKTEEPTSSSPIQNSGGDKSKVMFLLAGIILVCILLTCCIGGIAFAVSQSGDNKTESRTEKKDRDNEKDDDEAEEKIAEDDSEDEEEEDNNSNPTPTPISRSGSGSGGGNKGGSVSGKTATVVDMVWAVTGSENYGSTISNPSAPELKTETDGQFIKVYYSVTNKGDSGQYLDEPQLRDSSGKIYEAFAGQWLYINYDSEEVYFFEEIQPGETKSYVIIYEVDKNASGLEFRVFSEDYTGELNGEAYIKL